MADLYGDEYTMARCYEPEPLTANSDGRGSRFMIKLEIDRQDQHERICGPRILLPSSTSEPRHEYFPFPSLDLSVALSLAASTEMLLHVTEHGVVRPQQRIILVGVMVTEVPCL
jgi:hypothetical protein